MFEFNSRRRFVSYFLAACAVPLTSMTAKQASAATMSPSQTSGTPVSVLNPWSWQDQHGFVQGRVAPAGTTIYCSGQTSVDADGNPLHKGDMAAQILRSLDNLETVLAQGNATLANVVRTTYFVSDVDAFFAAMETLKARYKERHCVTTSTLVGVKRLFHPDILFEIEAIAVV